LEKVMNHKSNMNVDGESDGRVVPTMLEQRRKAVGGGARNTIGQRKPEQTTVPNTELRPHVERLHRVEVQKEGERLVHRATYVTVADWTASMVETRSGPWVDGVTWKEYETDLDKRRRTYTVVCARGAYRTQPSKRAYIPKADGRQRPLGIAALEDKIVQRAVGKVLNQIYEEDFLGFSYGFRPGRSQHAALDALWVGIMRKKVSWVLDADIRDFFGSISHEWMVKFLKHRIADRRILRLIKKWLRAGVSEDGEWSKTEVGTPQGSVISNPLCIENKS
jgi:hypothetical protein